MGFAPATGTITCFRPPSGPGVRLDSGVETGSVVGGQFDSLLAKLIVTGCDRTQAIERARRALDEFDIVGVKTTIPFLKEVLTEPAFVGDGPGGFAVHTRWIEESYLPTRQGGTASEIDDVEGDTVLVEIGGRLLRVEVPGLSSASSGPLAAARRQSRERRLQAEHEVGDIVTAPMQGTLVRLEVKDGDNVEAGQLIAVVEAMKMENPLRAPHAGKVEQLRAILGATVAQGALICRVVAPG
jgi:acetyl-CoA/propionyl-CoA carboxylase biotin carboxyl carrier protein